MEGCCAVEREVDRVLTKFNTTQQVGVVKEKDLQAFEERDIAKNTMIVLFFFQPICRILRAALKTRSNN